MKRLRKEKAAIKVCHAMSQIVSNVQFCKLGQEKVSSRLTKRIAAISTLASKFDPNQTNISFPLVLCFAYHRYLFNIYQINEYQ
jgi:hypothetical protein